MKITSFALFLLAFLNSTFAAPLIVALPPSIPLLTLNDSINVGSAEYLTHALRDAEAKKTAAIIIKLDTPGGLLDSTREIVQAFLATPVKVIVWVSPEGARAASAGAMITLAAHFAAMSRATSIGAASPVMVGAGGDGTDSLSETMKHKITNDTLSFVEGIALERHRNVEWARKFVSEAASLNADSALKFGVIDAQVGSLEELWTAARKKIPELPADVIFEKQDLNLKEKILSFISNPNVAYALLGLGTLGIYMEMSHPGLVIPGTIGAVSLALGAISLKILPIRPGAVVLLFVALILLAVEFLTPLPTHGFAGGFGVMALFFSGVFLIDKNKSNLDLSPQVWLPAFVLISVFIVFIGTQSLRALKARPFLQGADALKNKSAVVTKVFGHGAEVLIRAHGAELWRAKNNAFPSHPLQIGDEVIVVDQKGFQVFVTKKGIENV